jgi:hypothetical protein
MKIQKIYQIQLGEKIRVTPAGAFLFELSVLVIILKFSLCNLCEILLAPPFTGYFPVERGAIPKTSTDRTLLLHSMEWFCEKLRE